jgi:predicted nucleic acid-binding protein
VPSQEDWPTTAQTQLAAGNRFGLSAYDAAYLSLAMQEGLPLATNDEALRKAADKAGVPMFGSKPARSRRRPDVGFP